VAKISRNPSGAPRWVPCPGAPQAEAPFPHGPTHPTTIEGRIVHWVSNRIIRSWRPGNEPLDVGTFLNANTPHGVVTSELLYCARVFLNAVWERAHVYPAGLYSEKQVSAWRFVDEPPLAGPCDAQWRSEDGTWVTVWDGKFGFIPKHAFENWQLISYGLGSIGERTQTVELVVVQPRGSSAARPVKTWILSVAELLAYGQKLVASADLVFSPNPPRFAGPHCYKCRAAGVCETLRASSWAGYHLALDAINVEIGEDELAYELEMMRQASDAIKARLDALQSLGTARIQAGHPVPGYAIETGLSNREWTMTPEQVIGFGRLHGVDLAETKPTSPNQAEGRGVPRHVIDLFTTRRETAPKLVRKRPNEAREVFFK
jgi:Protein of unknown function (DUF2800)